MEEMKELENRVLFEETGILEETEELKELERQGEDWVFWGGADSSTSMAGFVRFFYPDDLTGHFSRFMMVQSHEGQLITAASEHSLCDWTEVFLACLPLVVKVLQVKEQLASKGHAAGGAAGARSFIYTPR
ncbi:uncharacterized [Tachysurus ichikawai]